ncbi:MAG: hypothetical protein HN348_27915 [Proteobacteria bacterium]|nr:hypothetical protein [Pseudomonadota bacterium]
MSAPKGVLHQVLARSLFFTITLSGCSLGKFTNVPCTSNEECRQAFYLGSVCGEGGFCEDAEAYERCTLSEPDGAFSSLSDHGDDILVGVIFDHSADAPQIQSTELAIKQVRQLPKLDDREVTMFHCTYEEDSTIDDLTINKAAAATASYLVDTLGISLIIGPATSDACQSAFDAVEDTTFISPSASAVSLTEMDGLVKSDDSPGLFWRTVSSDIVQGQAIAADMKYRNLNRLSVIYQQSSYASGLADTVLEAFEDDPSRTAHRHPFALTFERDAASQAAGLDDSQEVLFISSEGTDAVAFINGVSDNSNYDAKTIFLSDSAADIYFLDNTQDESDGVYPSIRGSRPTVPSGTVFDAFRSAYAAEFDGEDASTSVYTSFSYDAAWIGLYGMAWAIQQEGEINGTNIAKGLRQLSAGLPPDQRIAVNPSNWNSVLARFAIGEAVDLDGASGHLDFDSETEETLGSIDIWVIVEDDGDFDFEADRLCEPSAEPPPAPQVECHDI